MTTLSEMTHDIAALAAGDAIASSAAWAAGDAHKAASLELFVGLLDDITETAAARGVA